MRRRLLVVLAALVLPLLAPAGALAQAEFLLVFKEYQEKGRITACKYTSAQLKKAKGQVPNDFDQYSPDFEAALDQALQARATGQCRKGGSSAQSQTQGAAPASTTPTATTGVPPAGTTTQAAPTATTPAATTPTSTPQPTPDPAAAPAAADGAIPTAVDAAPASSTTADDAPVPLVVLLVLGGLLLVGALGVGAARWWAWEPDWLLRTRHASAEAGWRASAAWSEFSDWVRLGR